MAPKGSVKPKAEPKKAADPKAKAKAEAKAEAKSAEDKKRKAEAPAEVKEAKEAKVEEFEEEQDDKPDTKQKIKADVTFLGSELTLNAVPCMGNKVLMALNEGGLQYLIAGARANVGLTGGRHMFEVKMTEAYHPAEVHGSRLKTRSLLRIGFSTAGSSLVLGDSEGAVYFDSDGNFGAGKQRAARAVPSFSRDQGLAVVLNLEPKSTHANTVSLFRDGQRICKPQKLPESLVGQPLFPHISFRHASVMVNFGKTPFTKMPFTCRMVAEAATAQSQVTAPPKDKCEVMLPVAFPDEGTFEWLDSFIEKNPQYTELSDRKLMEWAVASGLNRPKVGPNSSSDKPNYQYGLPSMDNGLSGVVQSISSLQPRNYIIMEVKSNLVAEERAQILKRFPSAQYKKVAHVVMGEPDEEYKQRVRKKILKIKQDKENASWRIKKAQQEQKKRMAQQQKEMAEKRKAEEKKQKAEEDKKKAEAGENEGELDATEEQEEEKPAEPAEDVEMKEEARPEPEEEDLGEEPPQVALTEEEEKQFFPPKVTPDLAPHVLSKAFANFTVPEKSEGFDEVKYEWQDAAKSKDYLRKWVLMTKLTTRIEDLVPSQYFKEKLAAWTKTFSELQAKLKAWKTGGKKEAKDSAPVDIFSVEDINDIGEGVPLYSHFEAEDWALLQTRYELFLLQDAFTKDVNDPDRVAIPEAHLPYYFNKYFKKQINTKQFGFTEIKDLLKLIKDTVTIDEDSKMLTKVPAENVESMDIFVKCTEESRKERQRRMDAGDETARLKFSQHTPPPSAPPAPAPPKGKGKGKGKKGKW